jgi:hypothetical protein
MELTPQQSGWVKLAGIKETLVKDLNNAEISIQGILADLQSRDHAKIEHAINEAKSVFKQAKGIRLEFTRLIDDKLINPIMDYEKRMQKNIDAGIVIELESRKAEAMRIQAEQIYLNEVAAFKTHIKNELARIKNKYIDDLRKGINVMYREFLLNKEPIEMLESIKLHAASLISSFKLDDFQRFPLNAVTEQQAHEIFMDFEKYDGTQDLENAIYSINDVFKTYQLDLQNAEMAILANQQKQIEIDKSRLEQQTFEKLSNELIDDANSVKLEMPKFKNEIRIVNDNTETWALNIITHFMKNYQFISKYIKVKSWDKLTLGQMSTALAKHIQETGEQIPSFKIEEICK